MLNTTRRSRTSITYEQFIFLSEEFSKNVFPSKKRREKISMKIMLDEKSVQFWFQNQRRKLKQSGNNFKNLDLLAEYITNEFRK